MWNAHSAPRLAAALAYYAILSLAPLILFIAALLSAVLGHTHAREDTVNEIRRLAGTQVAALTRSLLNTPLTSWTGWVASLAGGAIGLFSGRIAITPPRLLPSSRPGIAPM